LNSVLFKVDFASESSSSDLTVLDSNKSYSNIPN